MTVWNQFEEYVLFHAYWNGEKFIVDEILPAVKNDVQKWIDYGLVYYDRSQGPIWAQQIVVEATDPSFFRTSKKILDRMLWVSL